MAFHSPGDPVGAVFLELELGIEELHAARTDPPDVDVMHHAGAACPLLRPEKHILFAPLPVVRAALRDFLLAVRIRPAEDAGLRRVHCRLSGDGRVIGPKG